MCPVSFAALLLLPTLQAPVGSPAIAPGDNALIALVLKEVAGPGAYTVVSPRTRLGMSDREGAEAIEHTRTFLKNGLRIPGYDPSALVDALIEANRTQQTLTLPSNPEGGFLVDYDGRFARYFESGGGGWERLRSENPGARGQTRISIPVLDKEHHLLLVYVGTQYDWLAGSGHVIAYRLEKGRLREVGSVMMWIS